MNKTTINGKDYYFLAIGSGTVCSTKEPWGDVYCSMFSFSSGCAHPDYPRTEDFPHPHNRATINNMQCSRDKGIHLSEEDAANYMASKLTGQRAKESEE